ncbi:hypothetical protein [Shewanella halifaxensis]|uniref:hypothetical protein n=1 Tax=Shewanella halifaxensis TaxID=271098 RepID=UPI000D5989EC|nr:hypothetical protein [Shewanella halifaxensis]
MTAKNNSITKAQLEAIQLEMQGHFLSLSFKWNDHQLTIQKVRVAENKLALALYVDGFTKGSWFGMVDDDTPDFVPVLYRKRSRAKYDGKFVKSVIKNWGKRRALKEWPDLNDKVIYYWPYWDTASSMVRHLKTLKGLELVEATII